MSTTALTTLLEQATSERDQILAALQRAELHARRLQAQAEQLNGYRGEYRQRWQQQFSREGQAEIVQCYHGFMGRLEDVLGQQQAQVNAAAANGARLRQSLAAAELRVASVKKLIERRQAELHKQHERREQRHNDEMAQRLRWQRDTSAAPL